MEKKYCPRKIISDMIYMIDKMKRIDGVEACGP